MATPFFTGQAIQQPRIDMGVATDPGRYMAQAIQSIGQSVTGALARKAEAEEKKQKETEISGILQEWGFTPEQAKVGAKHPDVVMKMEEMKRQGEQFELERQRTAAAIEQMEAQAAVNRQAIKERESERMALEEYYNPTPEGVAPDATVPSVAPTVAAPPLPVSDFAVQAPDELSVPVGDIGLDQYETTGELPPRMPVGDVMQVASPIQVTPRPTPTAPAGDFAPAAVQEVQQRREVDMDDPTSFVDMRLEENTRLLKEHEARVANLRRKGMRIPKEIDEIGKQIKIDRGRLAKEKKDLVEAEKAAKGAGLLAEELKEFKSLVGAKKDLELLEDKLNALEGKFGPIVGNFKKFNPYSTKAQALKTAVEGAVPNLARGVFGEVGVLTDKDMERYQRQFPTVTTYSELVPVIVADLKRKLQDRYDTFIALGEQQGKRTKGLDKIWGSDYTMMEMGKDVPVSQSSKIKIIGVQ